MSTAKKVLASTAALRASCRKGCGRIQVLLRAVRRCQAAAYRLSRDQRQLSERNLAQSNGDVEGRVLIGTVSQRILIVVHPEALAHDGPPLYGSIPRKTEAGLRQKLRSVKSECGRRYARICLQHSIRASEECGGATIGLIPSCRSFITETQRRENGEKRIWSCTNAASSRDRQSIPVGDGTAVKVLTMPRRSVSSEENAA